MLTVPSCGWGHVVKIPGYLICRGGWPRQTSNQLTEGAKTASIEPKSEHASSKDVLEQACLVRRKSDTFRVVERSSHCVDSWCGIQYTMEWY